MKYYVFKTSGTRDRSISVDAETLFPIFAGGHVMIEIQLKKAVFLQFISNNAFD